MRLFALFFLLGNVVSLHYLQALPSIWLNMGAAVLALMIWRWAKWLSYFLLGAIWATVCMQHALQIQLAPELEGKDLSRVGYIASIPQRTPHAIRFMFAADKNYLLSWYGDTPKLAVGERWRLKVRLKRPHGFANPGGYRYELSLLQRNIQANGYVRASRENLRLAAPGFKFFIQQWRAKLLDKLQTSMVETDVVTAVKGLVFGMRDDLSSEQWLQAQRTGTSHLLAISGLHISFIAGLVFLLVAWVWRWSEYLCLRLAAPKAAAIAGLGSAWLYALLAGFSLPTQRAAIMLSCVFGGLIVAQRVRLSYSLALALLIILLINPLTTFSPGFWLSFSAVAMIAWILQLTPARDPWWKKWLRIQSGINLGLAPISLWFFQQTSWISFIANIAAIPWVSFVLVPLSLLSVAASMVNQSIATWIGFLLHHTWTWYWLWLQWLAQFPHAQTTLAITNLYILMLAVSAVIIMLLPRKFPARWAGLVLLFPILFPSDSKLEAGSFKLTVLDVGQGLATVVQTKKHTLVFDTGPWFSPGFDAGRSIVVPYLRYAHRNHIDALVVSHPDMDHRGGEKSILALLPVTKRWNFHTCRQQHWMWDGVRFEFITPQGDFTTKNNRSCALLVSNQSHRVLLPGDIEKPAEEALVSARVKPVTLLVAPHHGSRTSSSMDFLTMLKPEYVIFAVGYRNRFHFPRGEIVARYRRIGSKMLRTDRSGAIEILFTSGEPLVSKFRTRDLGYLSKYD